MGQSTDTGVILNLLDISLRSNGDHPPPVPDNTTTLHQGKLPSSGDILSAAGRSKELKMLIAHVAKRLCQEVLHMSLRINITNIILVHVIIKTIGEY